MRERERNSVLGVPTVYMISFLLVQITSFLKKCHLVPFKSLSLNWRFITKIFYIDFVGEFHGDSIQVQLIQILKHFTLTLKCWKVVNTTKDYRKRLHLYLVFLQCDSKPTKSGDLVRYCWDNKPVMKPCLIQTLKAVCHRAIVCFL